MSEERGHLSLLQNRPDHGRRPALMLLAGLSWLVARDRW
jgi:hypothetical protein